MRRKLNDIGLDLNPGTPAELAAAISREVPIWAAVVKRVGIKATD